MESPRPAMLPVLLVRRSWDDVVSRCNTFPQEATGSQGNQETPPLHAAITSLAPIRVINALCDAYPDAVSEKDMFGRLPIHLAVDFEIANEILATASKNAMSEENPINKLPEAALGLSPSRTRKKAKNGLLHTDPSKVESNRVEVCEYLLSRFPMGARLADDNKRLPLHVAAWRGAPTRVIEMLLEKNPSAATRYTKDGNLPLHLAARKAKVVTKKEKEGSKKQEQASPKKGGPKTATRRPTQTPAKPSATGSPAKSTPSPSGKRTSKITKSPLQKQKEEGRKARQRLMRILGEAQVYTTKAWPEQSPEDEEDEGGEEDEGMTEEQKEEKKLIKEENSKAAHAITQEIARCEARIKNIFLKQDKIERERAQLLAEKKEKEREEMEKEKELEREKEEWEREKNSASPDGVGASSDPIVKLLATSMSRHGRKKTNFLLKTKIIEKNCKNPVWDEYFEVTVKEEFLGRPFTLQAFDFDERDGDDPCGCVVLNLDELPCIQGEAKCGDGANQGRWETLIPNPDPSFKSAKKVTGSLRYEASFDPSASLLKLHIMEARDLAPKDFKKPVKMKNAKPRPAEPPKPKKKKEEKLDEGLEVLDLLLRHNCDGVNERDGSGLLPKQMVKAQGAKSLLDGSNINKNLVRWSKRENKSGDAFGEKELTMKMSEEVKIRVMEHEEERGLVFEDHAIWIQRGGEGSEGGSDDFGGYLDSARSALDHV
ncbi:hypothetical protein TrVE_jg13272 [Triparma verrucosa]|uniref:C2 domain-containing protein n=1 Tax=Triparma verrucosa TaxID=1606542 RepID=A0A9W7F8W5_9STRA|nr:hypothetical protein TrVE_jg13272 [Triparma verrucosa]